MNRYLSADDALFCAQTTADLLRLRNLKTPTNPVKTFTVTPIANSFGATIQFTLGPDLTGCAQINVLRNGINDLSSATLLNTYPLTAENANGSFQYIDSDQALLADQFYWLQTIPLPERAGLAQTEIVSNLRIVSGPVTLSALNANLLPPDSIADWSASLGAGSVVQLVCVNFQVPSDPNFGSCQIQVTGYLGDTNSVIVAQSPTSPFSFTMQKTGETVTLKAFAISQSGIEATSATSITLTLNGSETVPATLENVETTVITTGVQVDFDAALEADITSYKVYRGPHGSGFGAATLKTSIASSGSRHYTYLDPTGVSDVTAGSYFDYFVTAVNAAGESTASAAAAAMPPLQNLDQIGEGIDFMRLPNAPTNRNLIPDSSFKTWNSNALYWVPNAWTLLTGQGQDGGNAIGYLGTGSASGFPEVGQRKHGILLAPGNYTLSAYMDATQMTTQHLDIGLYATTYPGAPTAFDGGLFHLTQSPGAKGRAFLNFTLSIRTWAASTAFAVNDLIVDTHGNLQIVITAGTSGGGPTWSTTLNGHTTDGTVTWAMINAASNMPGGTKVPFNILMFPSNAVVNSGKYVIISNPQLEVTPPSNTPTPYKENPGDDVSGTMLVDLSNTSHGPLSVSTNLNPQGSILPGQAITIAITINDTNFSLSWSTQPMLRADNSTLTVNSGSQPYSGLSPSTKYYVYAYINVSTGNIGFANGSPPGTSPNSAQAMQIALDGRIPLPPMVIQTLAAGGSGGSGTGGGGGTCPEENETVEEQTKGIIKVIDVEVGDMIKGYSFTTGTDVFRRVIGKLYQSCPAWRIVDGYKVTPCEQIYHEGSWKPAFKATGATPDTTVGYRVEITVEADEDNEHNYWLVGRATNLLIHNFIIIPC